MENKSIKDKILYWGGITLISSVVLGGSYYIYKSIFGSEKEDNNIDANENNSLGDNSFILNDKNNIKNNIINENNIDTNTSKNIQSSIFSNNINEKNNSIDQSQNNNILNGEEKEIQSNSINHNDKESEHQNDIEKKDINATIPKQISTLISIPEQKDVNKTFYLLNYSSKERKDDLIHSDHIDLEYFAHPLYQNNNLGWFGYSPVIGSVYQEYAVAEGEPLASFDVIFDGSLKTFVFQKPFLT